MPKISKAERDRLIFELSRIKTQWTMLQKFLADEDEALSPIWDRWVTRQAEDTKKS